MRPRKKINYSSGDILKPKGILYVPVKRKDLDLALQKTDHYIMAPGDRDWETNHR